MKPKNLKFLIIPFFLLSISLISRLFLLSKGPFHIDCLSLVMGSQQTLQTGRPHFLYGSGYPLTILLGAWSLAVSRFLNIPDPVWAINAMSAVSGSLGVVAFYFFVGKFINKTAALFGAILLSFHPFYFGESTYGMSHAPSLLFLMLSLGLLIDFLQSRRLSCLLGSGLALGLMGASRLHDLLLMLLPVTSLFFFPADAVTQNPKRGQPPALYFIFILLALFIAFLFHLPLYLNHRQEYVSQLSHFWGSQLLSNYMGPFSRHLIPALFMITFSTSPIGVALAIGGLARLWQNDRDKSVFLILWFAACLSLYGNVLTTTSRFLTIAVVPFIIAEGYALSHLFSYKNRLFKCASLFTLALILFITFREVAPVFLFRHRQAVLPDFARWVASVTEPDAGIIATDDRSFIAYYGGRQSYHNPCGIAAVKKDMLPAFREGLDEKLRNDIPVYITWNGLTSGDRTKEFRNFMMEHYDLVVVGNHLSEDFHRGSTVLEIGQDYLFRIQSKGAAGKTPSGPRNRD